MTTKRGSIHFAIPLPVAMDPASLERLTKVNGEISAFTAAVVGLSCFEAYRLKGERGRIVSAAPEQPRPSGTGPALPVPDAGPGRSVTGTVTVDSFAIPAELRR